MDEYPDPEEEYELLHQEEMEAMRQMEEEMLMNYDTRPKKSKNQLNFDSTPLDPKNEKSEKISEEKSTTNESLLGNNRNSNSVNLNTNFKKRCLSSESLCDITSDLEVIERPPKKHKNISSNATKKLKSSYEFGVTSLRVPKWPFMPVNTDFGEKIYVKISNESLDVSKLYSYNNNCSGVLLTSYSALKELAEKVLKEDINSNKSEIAVVDCDKDLFMGSDLWVEKFKPKTYFDLLSDEAVNRTLLNWLKMWDKVVFNKEPKVKPLNSEENNERTNLNKELDSDGRPHYKISLLCGPPGLGKTTLAHVVAFQAGYNAIEVNASDDRTIEAFSTKLEAATQMKSVMGNGKPNCLILDEIDGAPLPTIEFLLKYVNGQSSEKGKKGKKHKPGAVLKRPVICICNELYTPSLRHLRQQAFVVHFPHTSSTKLAQRLLEICRKQDIKTDLSTLTLLCDKAQNDIRSCISTLHFFKSKNGQRFKSADVIKSEVGQKDFQKGVFNMWKEIFQVPIRKRSLFLNTVNKSSEEEVSSYVNYSKRGMDRLNYIVQMLQSSGDYERLVQGVYENFLKSKFARTTESIIYGLEWFSWFDLLDTTVKKDQNFVLMKYLPYSFAAWHLLFSSSSFWKISYPSAGYENHVKEVRCRQILGDVLRGLDASVRSHSQRNSLLLDILPLFNVILVPPLRPVNHTLFNENEKKDFKQLLDVMIDYNLNFIQQRSADGTYFYQLDPNIDELIDFKLSNQSNNRSFSYNMKQMISHEVELEKLRKTEGADGMEKSQSASNDNPDLTSQNTPPVKSITSTLKDIKIKENEGQYKDFFGRVVKVKVTPAAKALADENNPFKSPIWFSFKEGYNNAVKKDITMADIL